MYFCPCPCSEPLDPDTEEAARVSLPRNLSYVQESYLDRYSVSACFVHNPKIEGSFRREQQLAQDTGVVACGAERGALCTAAGSGDRAPPSLSSLEAESSNVIPSNVEDETVALLSILKGKEYRGRAVVGERGFYSDEATPVTTDAAAAKYRSNGSDVNTFTSAGFHNGSESSVPFSYSKWTATSIGFLDDRGLRSVTQSSVPSSSQSPDSSSPDQAAVTSAEGGSYATPKSPSEDKSLSPSEAAASTSPLSSPVSVETTTPLSSSPVSLLLSPASRVASRLSALLHTPPNESMDAHRQGTSVDGDSLNAALIHTRGDGSDSQSLQLQAPDGLGQDMDRGDNVSDTPGTVGDGVSTALDVYPTLADTSARLKAGQGRHIDSGGEISSSVGPVLRSAVRDIKLPGRPCHPTGSPPDSDQLTSRQRTSNPSSFHESPDSDAFSEEGVFVNMMDDLLVVDSSIGHDEEHYRGGRADGDSDDDNDKSLSISVKSDETCLSVDSMFMSPEEGELEEEVSLAEQAVTPVAEEEEAAAEPPKKMSLQEAISRAANDLNRMSLDLYGSEALQKDGPETNDDDTPAPAEANSSIPADSGSHLASFGRSSPVRTTTGLKLTISDYSSSSSSSLTSEHVNRMESGSTDLGSDFTDLEDGVQPESPVYPETEFNFNRKALRKSSSLKTNKTPPGTPHRKKAVRFADAMGLDLESVRHVLNTNSPPKIPPSAMADLQTGLSEDRKEIGSKYLCPCFSQPGASEGFYQRVMAQKVCLENAIITDLTITGFVRVANIAFHKSVRVRYTHNAWATFHDIAASYVQNSCDGPTDRFSFSLVAPAYFVPGHRLEFAVSFNAEGTEFWDNNAGQNYVFECFAKTVPTESESAWIHFL